MKKHLFYIGLVGILLAATFIDGSAQILSNPELIPYRKGNKWGYCNEKKEIIIPCRYDSVAEYFFQQRAYVMRGEKFGYVDPSGKEVIPLKFNSASNFADLQGIALVTERDSSFWIARDGNKFEGQLIMTDAVGQGFMGEPAGWETKVGDKFAFISTTFHGKKDSITGKMVQVFDTLIKPVYQNLVNTHAGLLLAKLGGKWGAINIDNEVIISFTWDSLSPAYRYPNYSTFKGIITEKDGLYGLMDITGNIMLATKYTRLIMPNKWLEPSSPTDIIGIIHVQTSSGRWGYINQHGVEYFEE